MALVVTASLLLITLTADPPWASRQHALPPPTAAVPRPTRRLYPRSKPAQTDRYDQQCGTQANKGLDSRPHTGNTRVRVASARQPREGTALEAVATIGTRSSWWHQRAQRRIGFRSTTTNSGTC